MKIQYALMSCNANSRYTAYWPTAAAAWLKLGITPVCLFLPDKPDLKLPPAPEGSIVHTIPPLSDVHIMPQVMMSRFWASYLYPDAIVISSNIDFIPLSKHFFHSQLARYPDHAYLHLQPKPAPYIFTRMFNVPETITQINKMRYLYSLFHVAKGQMMHRVLNLLPDWEASCKKTLPYYLHKEARIKTSLYSGSPKERIPWFGDEIYNSIQLHFSSSCPLHYISYQSSQYSEPIWDIIPFVDENINTKRDYVVGVHLPSPTYPEDSKTLEHLISHGSALKPQGWWYVRFWYWLINHPRLLKARVKSIGTWVCLSLIILMWCALHLLPPVKPYNKILVKLLGAKRITLLAQNTFAGQFFHQLLRIKNMLATK